MEDGDYAMGEDTIVDSTETNGDPAVDKTRPSEIFTNMKSSEVTRQTQLPFHSQSNAPAALQLSIPHGSSSSNQISQSPGGWSDKMYVKKPKPLRRSSPQVRIAPQPRSTALPYATMRTGLVYDPRMRFHAELPDMGNDPDDIHPEDPRRIHAIFEEIKQAGLVGTNSAGDDANDNYCWRIGIRPATRPEILLVHTAGHYALVEALQTMTIEELRIKSIEMDSIYFNHSTYECAKLAAGGAIEACKAVVEGAVRNAIAIIRPPGHHAESTQPSGFCIFDNVAIATRVCQNAYPESCRKVLILDWDVHHGNGIQHAFYDDPNVLYISLHVYKNGTFYPSLPDGNLTYCGGDRGEGMNVNVPWAEHGMGDAEYLYAFQEVVMPIATEFDPDLVIISAGFDAAEGDVLGGCHVSPACYGHMTHMLMRLAQGKVVVCLEGGYNLRSIARSALAVTRVLMLEPPDRLQDDLGHPQDSAVIVVDQVRQQHSKYWKCLYPKHLDKVDPGYKETYQLHKIIREWQSLRLSHEHAMTPLQINKTGLSQTFEHNVIATPNFMERHPLLVIFHDPPNFEDYAEPITGRREMHNTWLTDPAKRYIDWAVANDFQVIDVNIPRIVSVEDSEKGYIKSDNLVTRAQHTRELAGYLWDNYIEPNDATQVFLMGVGHAHFGLVDLLSRNENTTEPDSPVEMLIGFVADTTVCAIKRSGDDTIQLWYHAHSNIFVQNSHQVWDPQRQRKLRKRLGNLIKSPKETLDEMLEEHLPEVQALLLKKKSDFEETKGGSGYAEDGQSLEPNGLQSPTRISGASTPKLQALGLQQSPRSMRSPKLPAMGYFSIPATGSRSPRSPMKRT